MLADNKLFREFNDEIDNVLKRLSGSVQILLFTSSERNEHVFRLSKEYMRSRLDGLVKKEMQSLEGYFGFIFVGANFLLMDKFEKSQLCERIRMDQGEHYLNLRC